MKKDFIVKQIFDSSFQVHRVAMAISSLLVPVEIAELTEEEKFYVEYSIGVNTVPFYNGRERGLCIYVQDLKSVQLNIVFGENRNSDNIFIDIFETPRTFNPPSLVDFNEEMYEKRIYLKYNEIYKASVIVQSTLENFLKKRVDIFRDSITNKGASKVKK